MNATSSSEKSRAGHCRDCLPSSWTNPRQAAAAILGVTFLSSSGLRALLLVRKELLAQNGELRLCALKPQVREVFTLTGFTQVFAIHSTREEALRAFGREPV